MLITPVIASGLDSSTTITIGLIATIIGSALAIASYIKGVRDTSEKDGKYRAELRSKVDYTLELVQEYKAKSNENRVLLDKVNKELVDMKMKLSNYEKYTDKVDELSDDYVRRQHEKTLRGGK